MIKLRSLLAGCVIAVAVGGAALAQPTPIPSGGGSGGGSPTGAAGGDLTGTYPNPSLATVNSDVGTFGSDTDCPTVTVNAKGLITAISEQACASGAGDITAVTAGAGLTGGGSSGAITISASAVINAQTGTSYTVLSTDAAKLVTFSNGSAVAVTLPQATGDFAAGFSFGVQNKGVGTATITPTTSTINGGASLAIATNQGCWITSDGTNYQVDSCTALGPSGVSSITGTANQITASASTGAVTLSLPANLQTTTLALNGCTIGALGLCVNGAITSTSGDLTIIASGDFVFNGRGRITSPGSNVIQIGGDSSAAPAAQSLFFQNAAGTNIAAAATATIVGPLATGTGVPGDLVFQTGVAVGSGASGSTATNAVVIKGETGLVQLPRIATDATHTTSTICQDTTTHALYFGSGTAGICLGTSSARYKHDIAPLSMGLSQIMALKPVVYKLNKDKGDPNKTLYGFLAEDMEKVAPALVGRDKQGRADTADYVGVIPILVNAVQTIGWLVWLLFFWNALLTGWVAALTFRKRA
jgi:hypothetical protein